MNESLDQVAGLIAGFSALLAFTGYALAVERRRLDTRLAVFVGGRSQPLAAAGSRESRRGPRSSFWRQLPIVASAVQLTQAGVSLSPRRFAVIQLATGLFGTGVARVVTARVGLGGPGLVLVLVIGTLAGLAIPRIILRFKRGRRLTRFEGQFASALDSLANAMEVGLSLSQALETVSRDMPAPLGPEFGQVVRGLGMGLPLAEALDQLAERVPIRDVEIFVTAVHIQYRTGGALTTVLRNIATTVRQRVNLRSEIRAMTAQQRFSAYLISGLPVLIALAVKFLSPEYFNMLLAPGTMRALLVGGCCGIVFGFYFMMRIADIEV